MQIILKPNANITICFSDSGVEFDITYDANIIRIESDGEIIHEEQLIPFDIESISNMIVGEADDASGFREGEMHAEVERTMRSLRDVMWERSDQCQTGTCVSADDCIRRPRCDDPPGSF